MKFVVGSGAPPRHHYIDIRRVPLAHTGRDHGILPRESCYVMMLSCLIRRDSQLYCLTCLYHLSTRLEICQIWCMRCLRVHACIHESHSCLGWSALGLIPGAVSLEELDSCALWAPQAMEETEAETSSSVSAFVEHNQHSTVPR